MRVFVSYATEDEIFATKINDRLSVNSVPTWFAPLSLIPGDQLLSGIEKGINQSDYGLLILSKNYLNKKWTKHEMDTLLTQRIEKNKRIIPIWLNVDREEIDSRSASLGQIIGIKGSLPIDEIIEKILIGISNGAKLRGFIPIWEIPLHRFLVGFGEIMVDHKDGPATTIFELLLHRKSEDFPLWIGGQVFSRSNIAFRVYELLATDPSRAERWVRKEGINKLNQICTELGHDPKAFPY